MALIVDVEKKLGSFTLKMAIESGNEILALLGASGSGKSMTLKCIAGIERPDRGHIELNGRVLFDSDKKICLPPQKRRVGYLFQQYALFPNMTVRENIACGLRRGTRGKGESDRADDEKRIAGILHTMHLEGLEHKYPSAISGGEQQRTAVARILINEPEVLLLDEPFSALDAHLRFRMEQEMRDVLRGFGRPVILVSHDRDEVYRLADRIAVIRDGAIETIGNKQDVFADPQTVSAARMTGCKNISRIRRLDNGKIFAEEWGIPLHVSRPVNFENYAGIRMHDLQILDPSGKNEDLSAAGLKAENCFICRVAEEIENPFSYTIMIRPQDAGGDSALIGLELEKKEWQKHRKEKLQVCFPPEKILLLQ